MNNCVGRQSGWCITVLMAVACWACAQAPVPKDQYYRLTVSAPAPGPELVHGSIEVHRFSADDLTAGRAIVYSRQGQSNQLMSYHYHFWVESPTTMLQQELVRYLRTAQAATAVTTTELRTRPDYVLHGRIRHLEQVAGPNPAAAIALELIVKKSGSDTPALVRTYARKLLLPDNSVAAAVAAVNQGLNEIYGEFLRDLSGF